MEINNHVFIFWKYGFQFPFQHDLYLSILSNARGRIISQKDSWLCNDVHFWRHMYDCIQQSTLLYCVIFHTKKIISDDIYKERNDGLINPVMRRQLLSHKNDKIYFHECGKFWNFHNVDIIPHTGSPYNSMLI